MPRARYRVARHHRKVRLRRRVKGYYGPGHRLLKVAKETLRRAGAYARRDRRARKRDFRRLWITRLGAACRQRGLSYSRFQHLLSQANIELNRKILAELAISDPAAFDAVLAEAKAAATAAQPTDAQA